MENAVIYARYSSHNQREESIEGQLRECHDFALRNDFRIVEEYCDRAISGKTDNRAAFQKLIKDSEKGHFSAVILYTLDRFARNRYDSAMYKAKLRKNGVKIYYAKQTIPDEPEGIILESVLEGFAEYYSANLSRNIQRGMYENAMACKSNGSGLALGYKVGEDGRFEIDPFGAKAVQEIYQMYADGKSIADIVRYCNAKGYRTVKGSEFNHNSLSRILRNDKYIGVYRHSGIRIEGGVPAIIDNALFEKVQERIAKNGKSRARNKAKADYLLSTKLFCGHCGSNMVGESGTAKNGNLYHYYKCANRKRTRACNKETEKKEWIENAVVKITVEKVLTDENIELISTKAVELIEKEAADKTLLNEYEAALRDTRKRTKNILDLMEQGIATPQTKDRLLELGAYEKDLLDNIEYEKMKKPSITKEQIMFWLESFRNGDINNMEYKRRIIDALVNAVYVYDTDGGGRKIVVTFNTTHNEVVEVSLSDIDGIAPPNERYPNSIVFINPMVFAIAVKIESVR